MNTPTFFENCALIRLVGKAMDLLIASFQITKIVVAQQIFAPPLATAALKQQKFRKRLKHVERGSHVEGLRRNSLNLQFQRFSISIDAMHISIDGC